VALRRGVRLRFQSRALSPLAVRTGTSFNISIRPSWISVCRSSGLTGETLIRLALISRKAQRRRTAPSSGPRRASALASFPLRPQATAKIHLFSELLPLLRIFSASLPCRRVSGPEVTAGGNRRRFRGIALRPLFLRRLQPAVGRLNLLALQINYPRTKSRDFPECVVAVLARGKALSGR
jgi:hypothetical protein